MKKCLLLFFFVSLLCFSYNAEAQRYLIIISSNPSKSVAENDVEKLQASGFVNAGMLYHSGSKRYRVYLNSFDSKEPAQAEAEKYKEKYKDSWVYKSPVVTVAEKLSPVTKEALDSFRKELSKSNLKFDSIQKDITSIKDEIRSITNQLADDETSKLLEEKIIKLNDYVSNIEKSNIKKEQEIKALNEYLNKIGSDYVRSSDTVSYSWKLARRKFDFGNPKFSLAIGVTRSNLFSTIDSQIISYYKINTINSTNSFYGFNLIGGVNFSRNWSTELNLKSYIFNNNYFIFPSLDFKFSQQLGKLPVKINPSFGIGTEVLIPQVSSIKAGKFIFYSPGLELEFGLSKRISIFGKGKYHFVTQFYNNQYSLNKVSCLDISCGIRFNFLY